MKIEKNFIVIEGLDGSGTSTQVKLLAENIPNSFMTYEPTDNEIGRIIRKILRKEISINYITLAYLFAADRAEHLYGKNGIIEKCSEGKIVICDRYLFSSLAYQSLNMDFEKVFELNKDFVLPRFVIFLNTSVYECMKRIQKRTNDREIFEEEGIQRQILENYRKTFNFLKDYGLNYYEINGDKGIKEILDMELDILKKENIL